MIKGIEKEILNEWGKLNRLSLNIPPRDLTIDAIVISTGDWTDRVRTALDLWRDCKNKFGLDKSPILLPSGLVTTRGWKVGLEVGEQPYGAIWMAEWFRSRGVPEDKILIEPLARNTKESANFSLQLAAEKNLKKLVLTVSPYFVPRAYSTFVASILFRENPIQTKLYCIPSKDLLWNGFVPDEPKTRFEQIPVEIDRIHNYRSRGDVATEADLIYYTDWLHSSAHP